MAVMPERADKINATGTQGELVVILRVIGKDAAAGEDSGFRMGIGERLTWHARAGVFQTTHGDRVCRPRD